MKLFPTNHYLYVADNVEKDIVAPNILGWQTIGIKNKQYHHIHRRKKNVFKKIYLPKKWIDDISYLKI